MSHYFLKTDTPGEIKIGLDGVDPDEAGVAPAFSSPPAWVGGASAQVGVEMTITPGVVTGTPPPSVVRELVRGASVVSTLGSLAYTPVEADIGEILYVRETATNGTLPDAESTSAGTAAVEPEFADVSFISGFTADGTGSFVHATANILEAAETMAVAFSYRPSTPTADEYIFCKGLGASNGWAAQQRTGGASGVGQLRFQQAGSTRLLWDYLPEHIGKDMHFFAQRNASRAELWGRRGTDGKALLLVEDTSLAAIATNTNGPAFGNYQSGTAGADGPNPATCGIIGGGFGTTFLTESQVQTYFDACAEQGTVPADASFPGAVSVYQEVNGLENDQVGANDLTRKENTPGDLTTTSGAADYHAVESVNHVMHWGQSGAGGQAPFGDFASPYQDAYPTVQLARHPTIGFVDMDDSGAATGTGAEVAYSRRAIANGLPSMTVEKYYANGTSLDVDWKPDTGAQWLAGVEYHRALEALTMREYKIRALVYIGLEADANDVGMASRVVANLTAFRAAFLAKYGASLDPSFQFIFSRLSDNQARPELVTVQDGLDTFNTTFADVNVLNTDTVNYPDNLHADAPGIVASGVGIGDIITTGLDQAA